MRSVLCALLMVLSACSAPASRTGTSAPAALDDGAGVDAEMGWVTGTVAVVGSLPVDARTVLVTPGGAAVTVRGVIASEIRSLSGAEVAVYGRRGPTTVEAFSYQVSSVNGAPVVTGIVEAGADGEVVLRTAEGMVFRLGGGFQGLKVGQRVWVQGPGALEVRSYGVIAQ
jgi:hypothetical protein